MISSKEIAVDSKRRYNYCNVQKLKCIKRGNLNGGKNNKAELIQKSACRKSQYAIKKLSVGAVSVAVGSLLSLGVTSVQAEESIESSCVQIENLNFIEVDLIDTNNENAYNLNSETTNFDMQTQEFAIFESSNDDSRIVEEDIVSSLHDDILLDSDEIVLENYIPVDDIKEGSSTSVGLIPEKVSFDNSIIEEDIPLPEIPLSIVPKQEEAESSSTSIEILNLQLGKDFYVGNEPIKATLTVKNDKEITGANINFGNITSHEYNNPSNNDVTYLESSTFDFDPMGRITKDDFGNYIIDFLLGGHINLDYYSLAPGQFSLNNLSLYTQDGNVFSDDGTLVKSNFFYKQFEEQELTKADFEYIPFVTRYTIYEELVQEGKNGTIYHYSDGTQYTEQSRDEVKLYNYIDESENYWTWYKPNFDLQPGVTKMSQAGDNGITRSFFDDSGMKIDYMTI